MLSTLWAVRDTSRHGLPSVLFLKAAAAEKALDITKSLIDLAKIEGGLEKDITVYVFIDRVKFFMNS